MLSSRSQWIGGILTAFGVANMAVCFIWQGPTVPAPLQWIYSVVGAGFVAAMSGGWGYDSAVWARRRKLEKGTAFFRALSVPALLPLVWHFYNPALGRRATLYAIVFVLFSAWAGVRLQLRSAPWPDPRRDYCNLCEKLRNAGCSEEFIACTLPTLVNGSPSRWWSEDFDVASW